jgi:hypothetical protein
MRVRRVVAFTFFSVICAASAHASDLTTSNIVRAQPRWVYDDEITPGLRPYWLRPWQGRHYFPTTGRRPGVGRLEHLSNRKPAPAESYYRFWSTSSVIQPEEPKLGPPPEINVEVTPRRERRSVERRPPLPPERPLLPGLK